MTLSLEDRLAIMEIISLHGHFADSGELDRMDEVLTPDVAYDVSDYGFGVLDGLAALREAALQLGDANPVGHHVTNIVLEELPEGRVLARSKGIGIYADGTCGSLSYEDTVVRTGDGWRINRRVARVRRRPLGRD